MTGDADRERPDEPMSPSADDTDRTINQVRRLAEEAGRKAQQINDLMQRLAMLMEPDDHGQP